MSGHFCDVLLKRDLISYVWLKASERKEKTVDMIEIGKRPSAERLTIL